jgi:hypothetical protein
LCICYPGDRRERSASNRSEIDFVHGVSFLVDLPTNLNAEGQTAFRQGAD